MMGMGSNTYSFRNQNQNQNLINIGNYTQQPSTPTFNNEQNMIQQLPMMNYQPQTQFGSGINTYVG